MERENDRRISDRSPCVKVEMVQRTERRGESAEGAGLHRGGKNEQLDVSLSLRLVFQSGSAP